MVPIPSRRRTRRRNDYREPSRYRDRCTRSKTFYRDGLGCSIDKDYPTFVSLDLGDGSSSLALNEREAAAQDAGVPSEGSGFPGVSFDLGRPLRL
jgi:hypothetical protein